MSCSVAQRSKAVAAKTASVDLWHCKIGQQGLTKKL